MRRSTLLFVGCVLAVLIGELLLVGLGLPRFHRAHSGPVQFAFVEGAQDDPLLWTNLPSAKIVFEYDGDPSGTLAPGAKVEHTTSSRGFRGAEWQDEKPARTWRIAFLGDSFTFGEGVADEDTLPEQVARAIRESSHEVLPRIEPLNLGVGGLNTELEREVLERWALPAEPDLVVLVFVLNDAEPPAFRRDPRTGGVQALERGAAFPKGGSEPPPPPGALYALRSARLLWQIGWRSERAARTIAYYESLYEPRSSGWVRARRALSVIGALCREHDIPFVVVLYPILLRLDEQHPFAALHARIAEAARACGALVVDLLPAFRGQPASTLWVHPTDQHPNAHAHALAARALVGALAEAGLLPEPLAQAEGDR